jgi:hypothetical protein
MGNDGRAGLRLSLWPRALQLPSGRGARGAAPETARGLPSVKAPALTCVATYALTRPAAQHAPLTCLIFEVLDQFFPRRGAFRTRRTGPPITR